MLTIRNRAVPAALCAGAAALSLLTAAPAEAGETTYHGCKPGNVCIYRGEVTQGNPVYQTPGKIPDGKWGWVIVNNGRRDPGSDHVWFQYKHNVSSEPWRWKCLHYYPGSGFKLDVTDDVTPVTIRDMYWGGEC
ncbi:hypothetical protein [Nonomuraea basaltis]|uniref:hypothetical protein n=1 Tax=Nonomuraea basaltis TaxID=2495887 RepID=UPI00110C5047|nr:hypothetical protein [Nonomuraea basaltis]TMR90943.1 hypothetical protein EJK15_52565 [Nonomuraea basaltis]